MSLHVSIVTAAFNRVTTIGQALASVREQTWPNVEHIVIDGGSTDGTLEVLAQHKAGISQIVSEPDKGVYDALNKGIARASGDVIGFMHSDDTFENNQSLALVAAAFEDPAVDAVYGDLVYVSKDNASRVVRYWQAGHYNRERLAQGWMPPHPTFYVRRDVYSHFGAFDTRYRIAADYENMLRILWGGGVSTAYIPKVLVRMRTGGISNGSMVNMLRKTLEDFTALRQNGTGGVGALLLKNMSKLPQFVAREPLRLRVPRTAGASFEAESCIRRT